jgi:peptide/nickel transport system permease protein
MRSILVRRVVTLPFILFGVTVVLFIVSQVIPSDPVRLVVADSAPAAVKEAIRAKLGLDQPLVVQYFGYIQRLLVGDLGVSIRFAVPVSTLLGDAFVATLQLIAGGAVVTVLIAFPVGLAAAVWRDSWIDGLARSAAVLAMSIPAFVTGIVALLVFGFYLGWFPISGRGSPPDLAHMILPATVLGMRNAGNTARLLRVSMIEALGEDYIRSARSRGISERIVVLKYAFRNAVIPAITDLGVSLADMVGIVILVETIFAWPGIGRLVFVGIFWNDFPVIVGASLVLVAYAVLVNFIVDALYAAIDPLVRLA